MRIGAPAETGFGGENAVGGDGDRFMAAVKLVSFRFRKRALLRGDFPGLLQRRLFRGGELAVIQPVVRFDQFAGFGEGEAGAFPLLHLGRKLLEREFLPVQQRIVVQVGGLAVAEGQAAGFVVGGDHDQGFAGMPFGKFDRHLDRPVEGNGFLNRGGRVVRMTGPVDHAAFNHQEETVRILQQFDPFPGEIGEGERVRRDGPVDLVLEACLPGRIRRDRDCFDARLQRLELFDGAGHGVAVLPGEFISVRPPAVFAFRLKQPAARQIIDVALRHLAGDVVVAAAARHVGIERRRSRMVEADAGHHADLFAASDGFGGVGFDPPAVG